MTTRRNNRLTQRQTLITCSLFSILLVLFAAYIYFLSFSVVHVVIRKEVTSEIAQLNSDIGKLEAQYIDRQHAVSDEVAHQEGFVAVRDKIFLNRAVGSGLALSESGVR